MLNYNEIRERKYIVLDDEAYEVISSHVARKQQRKPTNQTKLKNLITGGVIEKSFQSSDIVEEADLSRKKAVYAFSKFNRQKNQEEYWFTDPDDKSDRFEMPANIVEDQIKFIKPNSEIDILMFNNDNEEIPIGIKLPIKIELKVVEAPPSIKGNTASGANKKVVLETGLTIDAPIFINEGDVLRVNTETGEYVERV